ncbi:Mis12-Mtw1 family protein [Aspergillus brunneoviolaceus CBS 621.78]|uniref:Uncharacterized protein n=1 Tax=Aspergillus brunneoviolaceus CBS 621.78 TaxID=1450534 RepID=A0ACD1FTM0_9EURO|nr:hypothetical protein BO95DRAFT_487963 [Aspergillus brunneoviolaceus CBS 621.78]RAH40347.1 hypothetical protein BO95DRAFT_487963 [Aspergillus brunneoviolaceus CBS 621.78]
MTVTVLATPTTTTTTTAKTERRGPLLAIDMATSQAQARPAAPGRGGGRRSSRRLSKQDKGEENASATANGTGAGEKKRKLVPVDEEDDGFQFTRIATKKPRPSTEKIQTAILPASSHLNTAPQPSPRRGRPPKKKVVEEKVKPAAVATETTTDTTKTRRKTKPSEGTSKRTTRGAAKAKESQPEPEPEPQPEPEQEPESQPPAQAQPEPQPERAKRSTRKRDQGETVPLEKKRRKGRPSNSRKEEQQNQQQSLPTPQPELESQQQRQQSPRRASLRNGYMSPGAPQAGTATISLPLADTPVIQRNREMRGKKSVKGNNRRSSLGMRGRRASSLIDSGASNALPHRKVNTADFYKHIAADLTEPRRMRQLLIWCGTRAIGDKPSGSRSEDESARLAARVIQEELLKDFESNSTLSNWFEREELDPPAVVVKKENPKNIQNADKIKELEELIQKLQKERHALNALLRPPDIPRIRKQPLETDPSQPSQLSSSRPDEPIDLLVLDPSQRRIYAQIDPETVKQQEQPPQPQPPQPTDGEPMDTDPPSAAAARSTTSATDTFLPPMSPTTISTRLSRVTSTLAPTLDSLAAGIHNLELYRSTSDAVSSQVLRICAERLEARDARNSIRRLASTDSATDHKDLSLRPRPKEDLGVILGALSRVERRA